MDEVRTHIAELLSMRGRRSRLNFVLTMGATVGMAVLVLSLILSTAIWEITDLGIDLFGWSGVAMLPIGYLFTSVCVQRLHDAGLNGLWVAPAAALVVLMPDLSLMFFVFAVLLTVLMVVPGTAGANRYGRNRFPHHSSFASSGFGGR